MTTTTTTADVRDSYLSKLHSLVNGGCEIVNDDFLDAVSQTDYGSEIRTARNRRRCGMQDAYIAWIHDSARPSDLVFMPEGYAMASKNS